MNNINPLTHVSDSFFRLSIEQIQSNKLEFEVYKQSDRKLKAVRILTEYTGGDLKECKEIIDLYWEGKLPLIREQRREKLEKLARIPLVNQLMDKIDKLNSDDLHSLLMKLSIDELLSIDEFLPESE